MGISQDRSDSILSDELTGVMASALPAEELKPTDKAALRRRVMARISAPAPGGTYTVRASESPWTTVSDLVQVRVVRLDPEHNNQTVLIRMLPGAAIFPHPHSQEEECLVLEGAIEIGEHRLYEGDMHVAGAGVKHPRITSPHGALLMIRSEIPPAGYAIA